MKKAKQIIGVLLIISAVAALVYWETTGRDKVVTVKILVAGVDITAGEIITARMLSVINAMPDTVVAGAFLPEEVHKIEGKQATVDIVRNQQITDSLIREPEEKIKDRRSPFVIKNEWISSRSSSLRRGDIIIIYSSDGSVRLGEFEVLFVKDVGDKEVTDLSGDDGRLGGVVSDLRNRTHSNGIISHLEILTELRDYQRIMQFVEDSGEKLLIVQKGD